MKYKALLFTFVFICYAALAYAAESKTPYYAVAACGSSPSAMTSGTPGRCSHLLMYAKEGEFIKAVPNPFRNVPGAGPRLITYLKQENIKVLIGDNFGSGNIQILAKNNGIIIYEYKGTGSDAIKSLLKN